MCIYGSVQSTHLFKGSYVQKNKYWNIQNIHIYIYILALFTYLHAFMPSHTFVILTHRYRCVGQGPVWLPKSELETNQNDMSRFHLAQGIKGMIQEHISKHIGQMMNPEDFVTSEGSLTLPMTQNQLAFVTELLLRRLADSTNLLQNSVNIV